MRHYVFVDEAGCLAFHKKRGCSKYFILCTITAQNCDIGNDLLLLRRKLAWNGCANDDVLHACEDLQYVRDQVFDLIRQYDFRIDATILEKTKAQPHITRKEELFYKYAWYYHMKYVAPLIVSNNDELLLTAASIGTNKKRASFKSAINDVVQQTFHNSVTWQATFWPAASDPCLIIADYCAWAIQRKWESNDLRSYTLIQDKIYSEYELWKNGAEHYY